MGQRPILRTGAAIAELYVQAPLALANAAAYGATTATVIADLKNGGNKPLESSTLNSLEISIFGSTPEAITSFILQSIPLANDFGFSFPIP